MHKGIRPHATHVDETNVQELEGMDFVFLCLDKAASRSLIATRLLARAVPFIDVGMGVVAEDDFLLGIVRVTVCTAEKGDHAADRLPLSGHDDDGPFPGADL